MKARSDDAGPVWLFDLDNTLYPHSCRLFDQIDRRMGEFVQTFLGLGPAEARRVQKHYLREYGTTMNGLMRQDGLDPRDYLEYVHAIDLTPVAPDPELDAALAALPGRKLIYTNGSEDHAGRVLERLGIARHFEAVFDIVAADYQPKPERAPFQRMLERHAVVADCTHFFDDMPRNLAPAAELGLTTVWVESASEWATLGHHGDEPFVHHRTDDLTGWLQGRARA